MVPGRPLKPPIYTLPHGIQVIGEYAPNPKCPYWRVRVRPHYLLNGENVCGGIYMARSRAVMIAHLGRPLTRNEHVHHRSENKEDDRIENLRLMTAAKHNSHHKSGFKHSEESKQKISIGLKRTIKEGRREIVSVKGMHQGASKLTDDDVKTIRCSKEPTKVLVKRYGVSRTTIKQIRAGKTWRHIKC